MIELVALASFDALDAELQVMNENGIVPVLPFIDAAGTPSIAHGTAPGGDGWAVDYEAPRDPDTGLRHCCECEGHAPSECDCGANWSPRFPVIVMVVPR